MSSPLVHHLEDHMNYYVAWFIGGFAVPFVIMFLIVKGLNYFQPMKMPDAPFNLALIASVAFGVFSFIIDPMVR